MPRPPRILVPDGIYHVAARGSDGRALFVDDEDRAAFLARFARISERHELVCIAYCLMSTHYHIVVQIPDARLSKALQELHTWYSQRFNRIHHHTAHLFRNRFMAELIDDDAYLLTACRYLAHNPVRAGLCAHPAHWAWSSYPASAGLAPAAGPLTHQPLRAALGDTDDWSHRYRTFVEGESPASAGPSIAGAGIGQTSATAYRFVEIRSVDS